MSTAVLPSLSGLGFPVTRAPVFATRVQPSISGKEVRIGDQTYPRYKWSVDFNFLRSSALAEFQSLIGFFNLRMGMLDSFLYTDADDFAVTGQTIAAGDGTTLAFQMVRTFGGAVAPVLAPNTVSKVYVDGVDQVGHWTVSNWGTAAPGILTFAAGHAPANTKLVTADFSYYWPCRMQTDEQQFSLDFNQIYSTKKFSFISVKN